MTEKSNLEVEVKIALPERLGPMRRKLAQEEFHVSRPRVFESNLVLDHPDGRLRAAGELIRIRSVGKVTVLTYKGPGQAGKHKSREEVETEASNRRNLELIFNRLGLVPTFRYEKYRTEFQRTGEAGVVTLDQTPIGNFLEIEGRPAWIDRTAARLGFGASDYITQSYGGLYLAHCRDNGVSPTNMVFKG